MNNRPAFNTEFVARASLPLACLLLASFISASAQIIDSGLAINHKLLQPTPICLGVSGQNDYYYDPANGGLGALGCDENALKCFAYDANGDLVFNYCYTGTLGSMVEDQYGTQYILSNWHVLANPPAGPMVGDPINHVAPTDTAGPPGSYCDDASAIPTTVPVPPPVAAEMPYAPPFKVAELSAWIEPGVDSDVVDAAIAEVYNDGASSAILDIPAFNPALQEPILNRVVVKSGRTTGRTWGYITDIDMEYGPLENQIEIAPLLPVDPFALPGDDGALVLEVCYLDPGPTVAPNVPLVCPVGLIWAFDGIIFNYPETGPAGGVAYANPITEVIKEFYEDEGLDLTFVPSTNCTNQFPFDDGSDRPLGKSSRASKKWEGIPTSPRPEPDPKAVKAAVEVKDRNRDQLRQIPGVFGHAVGLAENGSGQVVIKLLVAEKTDAVKRAAPSKLEGIPVEFEVHSWMRAKRRTASRHESSRSGSSVPLNVMATRGKP